MDEQERNYPLEEPSEEIVSAAQTHRLQEPGPEPKVPTAEPMEEPELEAEEVSAPEQAEVSESESAEPAASVPEEKAPPAPWEPYWQENHAGAKTFGQTQPYPYACPVDSQPIPPERKKKKRKKRRGIGVLPMLAISLVCALVGGLIGGAIAGGSARNGESQENLLLEQRIEALENAQEKAPQQQAYDAQPAINATQVYESNRSSVVGITNGSTSTNVFGQSSSVASSGSGFIIREDGYVVTNYHVVQGAQTLSVTLYNGMEYDAMVVGYDSTMDVALLKIDAPELEAVTVGDSDLLRIGDQVAAIGNPLGELTLTMTVGYVSALDREINTDGIPINMLQTDAAINSGNSGGPLFDMKGNVIGITTAKYSGSTSSGASIEGIGFAVPINDAMSVVQDLLELGYVSGRAYLGITAMDMDVQTAEVYSLPVGAYVNSVVEGGCAQKAGLQQGDIILGLGEFEIGSYADLSRALREFEPGEKAELKIYRAGASLTLQVIFDERPSEEELAQQSQPASPQQPAPNEGSGDEMLPDAFDDFAGGDVEDWFRYFFGW